MEVLTTTQLKKLNEKAVKSQFNRVLNIQDANSSEGEVLKAEGKHIIKPMLWPHCNVLGKVSCRCMVWFAVEGSDEPATGTLDITSADYEKLFGQKKARMCL